MHSSRLANGLTVISHHMPELRTVAIGIWVATGARHESVSEHGLSHLIEHMAFKGTRKRSARAIVEEIEQVGGEVNAATSLDQTAFFARVLDADWGVALEILADILLNPVYAPDDLEREKQVIVQEIAATRDSPDDIVMDLIQDAAYPGQPLGRPILGTVRSVSQFTADDLHRFRARRYHPDDIVVSAAGHIDHAALVRRAEMLLGHMQRGEPLPPPQAHYTGGSRVSPRRFEQVHIIMGYPAPPYRDQDFFAAQVLAGILGGGMSSRLFQEVREKRGLCYSIYASAWGLPDTGMLSIHTATSLEKTGALTDVIGDELARAVHELPPVKELERAKAMLKAGLLMSLESPMARVEQMARQMQALGRLLPAEELIDKVDSVARKDIRRVATRIFGEGKPSFGVAGAGRAGREIVARMEARAAR